MSKSREATVTFTLFQNVTVNLDVFERVYGLKPTKANIIEVATAMRGHTDDEAFENCVRSGGEIIDTIAIEVETSIVPERKPKRGAGSY